MGLINDTDYDYYEGGNLGGYQFVSLKDVISQFMAVYVGEEKLINKISRVDVGFWAQRALAELSFDTLRSFKAQQIEVPPSLTMRLPKDYVNYTNISWVDSAGIKHPLYSTKHTSNPYQIKQEADGNYFYDTAVDSFVFSDNNNWIYNPGNSSGRVATSHTFTSSNKLNIKQHLIGVNKLGSYVTYCYKAIDVSQYTDSSLVATATSVAEAFLTLDGTESEPAFGEGALANAGTYRQPATTVRVGLSTSLPDNNLRLIPTNQVPQAAHASVDYFDLGYLEWTAGDSGEKTLGEDEVNV